MWSDTHEEHLVYEDDMFDTAYDTDSDTSMEEGEISD